MAVAKKVATIIAVPKPFQQFLELANGETLLRDKLYESLPSVIQMLFDIERKNALASTSNSQSLQLSHKTRLPLVL